MLTSGWMSFAHVHRAAPAQVRGYRRRGDPVLARTRLGDQRGLADPLGQQPLAQRVVDLVAAGVGEILALEQHPHAQRLGQAGRLGDRGQASVGALKPASPARKPASAQAARKAASSCSHAGTSASGTKRPPNDPNRPRGPDRPSPTADSSPRRPVQLAGATSGTAATAASCSRPTHHMPSRLLVFLRRLGA